MGKCLSCSQDDEDTSMQNGHTVSTQQRSSVGQGTGQVTAPMTKYHPDPPLIPVHVTEMGDYPGPPGHCRPPSINGTNGSSTAPATVAPPCAGPDKKIFSQYPKLPPIRKPSNGSDGKRTSFTLGRDCSEAKICALFEQYKDPDEDTILADGIERMCADLEVRPDEFRVLVLAWKFQAETMCRFTRSEFFNGCKALHVDSVRGIQCHFPELLEEVNNRQTFKDLYRWSYKFGLDAETGQRTLPVDMAVSLWRLVFSQRRVAILEQWLDFLEGHPNVRGIPKDTWDMFLNFVEAVGDDLSSYDDTEAWPSLFDDFVEYENDRQNQNVKVNKVERDY